MNTLGEVKAALEKAYQAASRTKQAAEGRWIKLRLSDTLIVAAEMNGRMLGLEQAIDIVEQAMGNNPLPGMEVGRG